jgi:two-component system, NarL family, sensor histidine kinase EvgS
MVKAHVLITCCETLEAVCERHDLQALSGAVEGVDQAINDLHHSLSVYCNQP